VASRWTQAATILPPTIEVCGSRLLPFCLRHRVALDAINSPVLDTEKEMSAEHMLAAVRILSSNELKDLRNTPTLKEKYWFVRLTFSRKELMSEMVKLSIYMQEQSLWPRFWVKDSANSKTDSFPWPLAVVASLCRNGCSLTEAWTMPEAEAIWMHIAHCSASGADISVVSDYEWQAMEKHKKQELEEQRSKTKTT